MVRDKAKAKAIAEELLDTTGTALMSGDFDAFASCFSLPHKIETFDGGQVLNTLEDLRATFDKVRGYFRSNSVTDLVRHVMVADWVDDITIQTTHQSRVLSGVTLVQAPYPCLSVLKLMDGEWRGTSSQYAIVGSPAHNVALSGGTNSLPDGDTND